MEGFDQRSSYHHLDMLEHTLCVLDNIPLGSDGCRDTALAYAALLHDCGKPSCFTLDSNGRGHMKGHPKYSALIAQDLADRLRFPNDLREEVILLIRLHDTFAVPARRQVHKFISKYPPEFLDKLEILQRADIMAHSPKGRERLVTLEAICEIRRKLMEEEAPMSVKDLAVNGDDLIRMGLEPGPLVGKILRRLLEKVVNGEVNNNCEELVTIVREYIN